MKNTALIRIVIAVATIVVGMTAYSLLVALQAATI
jgi:hypothetical protein